MCARGSTVLQYAGNIGGAVIVCPEILPDMPASHLAEMLPLSFDLAVLSKNDSSAGCGNVTVMALPLNRDRFVRDITDLCRTVSLDEPARSDEHAALLEAAKSVLMRREHLDEAAAHKYLQKASMDSGEKMADIARKLLGETRF